MKFADLTVVAVTSIVTVGIIEVVALFKGYDGAVMLSSVSAIVGVMTFIGGKFYEQRRWIRKGGK